MNILIVGAAGNLGSHLTRHLLARPHRLRLLIHKRALPVELAENCNAEIVYGDLDRPASLEGACRNIDCVLYVAGVLFRPRPESFLQRTNTIYVENMVNAALSAGVGKFILVSFPHVEENTTPNAPARGMMEASPKSIHARTRLEAEKYLFHACADRAMTPVVLRAGVIYGRDVKLLDAAQWLMKHHLMAIWRKPTWVHLLSLPDFLNCVAIAIEKEHLVGVYNICDDQPLLLQQFLDRLAAHWKCAKPWRLPEFMFIAAAAFCETFATLFRTSAPLTLDLVRMGMTSVVADTSRMKREIMGKLSYPTIDEGITIL